MPARSSPTVKRRRLAAALRDYRETARLTIDDVAAELEWSTAKISRIENARVSVLPRDVKFLLRAYGLTEGDQAWDLLLLLAKESRQRGWWQQHGDAVPDWFQVFVGLEAEAATISGYDAEFVPGLLQTEDYARAVHQAQLVNATAGEIERLVKVRMERQEILDSDGVPHLWLVVNEAVIQRMVGGPGTMKAQLSHMIEKSMSPNVTLQVVPFTSGAHPAMEGSFNLLGFPEPGDPAIVYIEYHTGALYLEKTAETARYSLLFDHLRAAALSVADSRSRMARAADMMA